VQVEDDGVGPVAVDGQQRHDRGSDAVSCEALEQLVVFGAHDEARLDSVVAQEPLDLGVGAADAVADEVDVAQVLEVDVVLVRERVLEVHDEPVRIEQHVDVGARARSAGW
jgi:hypothetical protein